MLKLVGRGAGEVWVFPQHAIRDSRRLGASQTRVYIRQRLAGVLLPHDIRWRVRVGASRNIYAAIPAARAFSHAHWGRW